MKKKSVIWITIISTIVILAVMIWKLFGLAIVVMIDDMDVPDKNEIFELVDKNQVEIAKAIEQNNFENIEKIEEIEQVTVEEDHIDFYCGGTGIGSSTSYYGFYYSKDNSIDVKENTSYPSGAILKPDKKGYLWEEPDGDNRFYVEKITDGFFYYEEHY